MGALTANRDTPIKEGKYNAHPVKGSARIWAGAIVCVVAATNFAVPGADTAGLVMAGIATDQADNSAGSDGAIDVKVQRQGEVQLDATGTAPKVGDTVYIVDDHTVSAVATTNSIKAGKVTKVVSSTKVWVDITQI